MEIRSLSGDLLFQNDRDTLGVSELDDVDLAQANLRGYDFGAIMLTGNNMAGADLSEVGLYWCVLIDVNLEGANLEGANLQGTSLARVNFRGANLRNANLGPDNLGGPTTTSGSDFTGANLDGANLTEAWYDETNKFSEGFDPASRGMVLRSSNKSSSR